MVMVIVAVVVMMMVVNFHHDLRLRRIRYCEAREHNQAKPKASHTLVRWMFQRSAVLTYTYKRTANNDQGLPKMQSGEAGMLRRALHDTLPETEPIDYLWSLPWACPPPPCGAAACGAEPCGADEACGSA